MSLPTTPRKKQVVRKVGSGKLADFDEQWWPVTLLLFASAGALAAYAAKLKGFDPDRFSDPDPTANTWYQLAAIGASALVLLLGVALLRGSSQRRMQLGVFLSLLVHAILLVTGQHVYLTYFAPVVDPNAAVIDDEVAVSIPDYLPMQTAGEPLTELTRPADTQTRDQRKIEVAPQTLEAPKAEKEALQEPNPQQRPDPTPMDLQRAEMAPSKRAPVPAGEKITRQELEAKLRTENVPQQRQTREAELKSQADAPQTTAQRQENSSGPDRKIQANQPSPQNQPRPDLEAPQPNRSELANQLAAADTRADMKKLMTQALSEPAPAVQTPAPRAASAAADQTALDSSPAADARRAAAMNSASRMASVSTPALSLSPASAAANPQLSRQETPEPAATTNSAPSLNRSMQANSGGAEAGSETVRLETLAPSMPQSSAAAGGAEADAPSFTIERGNQGTPQPLASLAGGLPSPRGQGSGPQVGGLSAGPQRNTAEAGSASGIAAGGSNVGPPGRGRSSGNAQSFNTGPVDLGGAMTGAVGAAQRAGNAFTGPTLGPQVASSSDRSSFGERTSTMPGEMLRPSNGLGGAAFGPSGGAGGTAAGAAGGGSLSPESGAGMGGPHRDGGLADVASAGGVAGGRGRSRLAGGDTLASLPGAGMVSVGVTDGTGRTDSGADAPKGIDAAAGTAGMRREVGGLPVLIAAPEGPGGLSTRPARDLGLPSRRARPESEVVHLDTGRLIPERLGGKMSGGGEVRDTAVAGLKQRDPKARGELAKSMGGGEETEHAVEMGLEFLSRHQSPDGSWRLHAFGDGKPGYADAGQASVEADTAGTGLALLAFLGAGYTHHDSKYGDVIERGLTFLLKNQKPSGDLYVPPRRNPEGSNTWFYSHGIASIALCEALGMTRDDDLLRKPAQRAVDFIVASQDPQYGGWRYLPNYGSDTSVSGWQLMALKSAERVGLSVPPSAYAGVERWLNFAEGPGGNPTRYAYRPQSGDGEPAGDRVPNPVMTAEALLMRQYLGWTRGDRNLVAGADFLLTQLPALGTPERTERNSYYWYYATQVMFHMKGGYWKQWNDRLRPLVVDHQVREGQLAGSWDPRTPTPDAWGTAGGRIYVTTINLLILEVYYRYLPLYQNLEE